MEYSLHLTILLAIFFLSIICIREPMKIARSIVQWGKFVSGGFVASSEARDAIYLIENDPNGYEKKYTAQLAIIKLTGWVGLFVSLIGSCIITISK